MDPKSVSEEAENNRPKKRPSAKRKPVSEFDEDTDSSSDENEWEVTVAQTVNIRDLSRG